MKNKQDKIVAARQKLRERFAQKQLMHDESAPLGSGEPNRHGMPLCPPGQTLTSKWPVLDLGIKPDIKTQDFRLELRGLCRHEGTLRFDDLLAFEQVKEMSDFHCVTTWSRLNLEFVGVRLSDIIASADIHNNATHIMCYGSDDYSTNLSLQEALKSDVLLVYQADGSPLTREHGGPVRMITPQLYAWKGTKWINAIEFMSEDRAGFWEQNGYSMTGEPWREDRYS